MSVPKFAVGAAYGPVLTATELYLLQAAQGCKSLELNPILQHSLKSFHLVFNLSNGATGGYDNAHSDKDLPFLVQDEPATIPRVDTIHIISKISPWIATVHASQSKRGVTLGDIVDATWAIYGEHNITEAEWKSLPVREQERVRRANMTNQMNANPAAGWNPAYFSPPAANAKNFRRADWLKDKIFFDGLEQDDDYSAKRLGFKAPNVFVMSFCS